MAKYGLGLLALLLGSVALSNLPGGTQTMQPLGFEGHEFKPLPNDITESEYAAVDAAIAAAHARSGAPDAGGLPIQHYTFFPQAGTEGGDIWVHNYVDLNSAVGPILDWDCTDYTYDGPRGHDAGIRSFQEQAVGVPIFAVLDGQVIATHDGEFDMNTSCVEPANSVVIDHGGGHLTYYWHFKKNTVAVIPGQQVVAGTYLGDTGSSGCSTGPHLHFESRYNGTHFEPSSGPCNTNASNWEQQKPVERDMYIYDFTFATSVGGWTYTSGFPFRSGYAIPLQTLYLAWYQQNLPANSTWTVTFRRPDNSVFSSSSGSFNNTVFYRASYWWLSFAPNFDVYGTWHVELAINGEVMTNAPLEAVANMGLIVNRPPNNLNGVDIEPAAAEASDVLRCRIDTSLVLDDPDNDLVRYRYVWKVNGSTVRDVTHAGHMDALPRNTAASGDEIDCTVTPKDASLDGNSTTATTTVGCPDAPLPICTTAGKAALKITNNTDNSKDKLLVKLGLLPAGTDAQFGDPTDDTDYRLCVYDNNGVVLRARLEAGTTCDDKACWSHKQGKSFTYKDKLTSHDGIAGIKLKAPVTSALIKGKGAGLAEAGGGFAEPVKVQLSSSDGLCFQASFAGQDQIKKNETEGFTGKY